MGSFKIQVPVIVNSNTAQVLVVTEIPLTPPAFKIDEIHKVIEIDDSLSGQVGVERAPPPKNPGASFLSPWEDEYDMANLFAVRGFELVCVVAWLAGLVWVWRSRNSVYAGVYFGSSTLMVFDWIFNTSWFFKVLYDPQFIPLWEIQGVVQPLALVANYAFFFGVPVLLFVRGRGAMDRRFGGWGYLVVFLVGALLDLGFEIPMVKLGLWTYYQAPQFLIGGLPYSNVWYSGLLLVASYGAARLAARWDGSLKDTLPGREERWRGFGMGAAAIWSAFYAATSVQLIWYGLSQPWVQGPRPF